MYIYKCKNYISSKKIIRPFCTYKESDGSIIGSTIPSNGRSEFEPVFRSGCCAERGPKQFMEDEHLCIDNLATHLGSSADSASPGAFYGVSNQKTFV